MKTADFRPRSRLAEASAGLVSGFRRSVLCLAMAAVLYGGVLTPYVGVGATLLLLGAAVSMTVLALQSAFAAASGGPQDTPAAILFAVAATMSLSTFSANPSRMFATTVAVLVLACLLFGTLTYVIGRFRLGRFVQFLPYPVIGGFMAGTAWLLLGSGIKAMTDVPLRVENLYALVQPGMLERWVPAAAAGLLLFVLMRRFRHALTLPSTLLLVLVIFYVIAGSGHLSAVDLRTSGWLMAGIAPDEVARGTDALSIANVDIAFLVSVLPALLTLVALSTIQTLLNVTALEVATGHELDADAELRVTGLSNLLAAPFGGAPAYLSFGSTTMAWRAGAVTRWVGLVGALTCIVFAVTGPAVMGWIPKVVLGTVIFMEAIDRLYQWLVDEGRKLSWLDYSVVVAILAAIAFVGFLEGIVLGIMIVVVVFVAKYSRINPIRSTGFLDSMRSSVARSPAEQEVLKAQGHRVLILKLHGFVFFGTAGMLLREIKTYLAHTKAAHGQVIIDFRAVTGLDASTGFQFAKTARWLQRKDFILGLTDLRAPLASMLTRAEVIGRRNVAVHENLDLALEAAENELLRDAGITSEGTTIVAQLIAHLGDPEKAAKLLPYLEPLSCARGATIIEQGEASEDVYFLESGFCSALIQGGDDRPLRLRKFGPGAFFGEMAIYMGQPRTASVIADTDAILHRLTPAALVRLAQREPSMLSIFHELMARTMAERIMFHNRQIVTQ